MADADAMDIGVFNYASSYLEAGRALKAAGVRSTHSDAPVQFLYYHAIELFLKSFLMLRGCSLEQLRKRPFGHRIDVLAETSVDRGLHLDDEDKQVIDLMATGNNVIDARYLRLGLFRLPTIEALDRTAQSLRRSKRR
jgi:hypothetical protein